MSNAPLLIAFFRDEKNLDRRESPHFMTKPVTFTTGDVTRLVKALRKAGAEPSSIEIDPSGRIVARFGMQEVPFPNTNPWDDLLTRSVDTPAQRP